MHGPNRLEESPIAIEGSTQAKFIAAQLIQEQIEVFRVSAKPQQDFAARFQDRPPRQNAPPRRDFGEQRYERRQSPRRSRSAERRDYQPQKPLQEDRNPELARTDLSEREAEVIPSTRKSHRMTLMVKADKVTALLQFYLDGICQVKRIHKFPDSADDHLRGQELLEVEAADFAQLNEIIRKVSQA